MHFQIWLAFLSYFFIIIIIGLISSKTQKNASDFILGGRNLNHWTAAISANAADMSIWLFMGLPANIYLNGIIGIWMPIGLIIFMFLNWYIIAPRLRIDTEKYKSLTILTYLEAKLNEKSNILRLLCVSLTLIFLTIYISVGLIGIGYVFETTFHKNYHLGCCIGMLSVIIYTFFGGFKAITSTNIIQGIFLLIIILLVPNILISHIGGFNNLINIMEKQEISLSLIPDFSNKTLRAISNLTWGIGYFGQPHILNKFMAIKNINEIKKATIISSIWQISALFGAILIGLSAIGYFTNSSINSQTIFIEMTIELFHPFYAGIILCAMLAATFSTIDSQILVLSSMMSEDIYKKIVNTKASDKQIIAISRISIIIISLISLSITFITKKSIFILVTYCWSGLGCALGPTIIMCLYFKKINKYGVIFGIIVGGIIGIIWIYFNLQIYSIIPGFLSGLITIYSISKLFEKYRVN